MAKNEKKDGNREVQEFENLEDKRNFFGKIKSFLMIFLKFNFDGKNKHNTHKV